MEETKDSAPVPPEPQTNARVSSVHLCDELNLFRPPPNDAGRANPWSTGEDAPSDISSVESDLSVSDGDEDSQRGDEPPRAVDYTPYSTFQPTHHAVGGAYAPARQSQALFDAPATTLPIAHRDDRHEHARVVDHHRRLLSHIRSILLTIHHQEGARSTSHHTGEMGNDSGGRGAATPLRRDAMAQTDEASEWKTRRSNNIRMRSFGFSTVEELRRAIAEEETQVKLARTLVRDLELGALSRVQVHRAKVAAEERALEEKCAKYDRMRKNKTEELMQIALTLRSREEKLAEQKRSLERNKHRIAQRRDGLLRELNQGSGTEATGASAPSPADRGASAGSSRRR